MKEDSTYIRPRSVQKRGESHYHIEINETEDALVVSGPDSRMFEGSPQTREGVCVKRCPLTVENAGIIMSLFDYTKPKRHKGRAVTIGLGDRLGIASGGHIELIRDLDVFPVLAQQSIRELNLTGRNYGEVLAAAAWAVFSEGYAKGYGADGDHLKTLDEIKYALNAGFSMITLDCSEHIRNDLASASQESVDALYERLDDHVRRDMEDRYPGREFPIEGDVSIWFAPEDFRRMAMIYLPAIIHAEKMYEAAVKSAGVDYEISIDETLTTTTPQSHYFVADELIRRGVEITSLAPRFVGEFQKGIDYRGDIPDFRRDFELHAKIAAHFGYKISVHSGSDKFSIFPSVNALTGGRYHLKTAGTNWLEAVRVIAQKSPGLYREIHAFALDALPEAKKYYHITANTANIEHSDRVSDDGLASYLDKDDSRQVLHITYGLVLQALKADGTPLFRDRIYDVLRKHDTDYRAGLRKHIGKHLERLGYTV